jgi:Nucleotidyl transferase AbiEii toxin, Type IV TA system
VEDDSLTFLPDTIRVDRIRDDETYEGVRVRLEARLGKVRVALQIDVGLGDAIVPGPEELEYPTILKFPAPKLHAYSKESVVAEKFEAMVKLGMANSRMKDFYDLWVLVQRFQFKSATLAAAIQATFAVWRMPQWAESRIYRKHCIPSSTARPMLVGVLFDRADDLLIMCTLAVMTSFGPAKLPHVRA